VADPRTAQPDDVPTMAEVLADAFFDDPIFSWLFPDPLSRPRVCEAMFTVLGTYVYVPEGESVVTDDAAAFWEPPDPPPSDLWAEHGEEFVTALEGQVERIAILGATMSASRPTEPYWYLSTFGVRTAAQGRGLGGRLLRAKLDRIDAHGMPAYLEASSPRSRVLYERHGFEVVDELRPEGGPPMWAMWREPRPHQAR
jgi:ribosomal protein S18 acetylase RimI-like enzyme